MIYQQLNAIFQHHDHQLSAAHAHGMATAMLCVDGHSDAIHWLKDIFIQEVSITPDDHEQILSLFKKPQKQLNSNELMFEFDLFLPESETLLAQAEALIQWCEGFLWGMAHTHQQNTWQKETKGILADIVEFTKLDRHFIIEDNENEYSLTEIHEYLRAAVLIIRDEIQPHM